MGGARNVDLRLSSNQALRAGPDPDPPQGLPGVSMCGFPPGAPVSSHPQEHMSDERRAPDCPQV